MNGFLWYEMCSELEALQVEKRNLHAYLKVYER